MSTLNEISYIIFRSSTELLLSSIFFQSSFPFVFARRLSVHCPTFNPHKIDTQERYLERFLSNAQVSDQKECGIWLENGTIMSELTIKKAQISLGRLQIQRTQRKQGKLRRIKCKQWCSSRIRHANTADCGVKWRIICQKEGTNTQRR